MTKINIPIDTGFYQSSSLPLAAQSCINLYPQNPQARGPLSQGVLMHTPGIRLFTEMPSGVSRGMTVFKGDLYGVWGTTFYKVSSDGLTKTNLGTIAGTGRCMFASNGLNIMILVPGVDGYFYDTATGVSLIVDPEWQTFQAQAGGVTSVDYKDGQYLYTTDEEIFVGSVYTVNSGKNFDSTWFGTAELSPDDVIRGYVVKNEWYIFGGQSIEVFQNIGTTGFNYQRIQGAAIDKGLAARFGVTRFDNSFVYLGGGIGESVAIWRGDQKLSTAAIDYALQRYTTAQLGTCVALTYSEEGSSFVAFNFPDRTFCYDATSSALQGRPVWHERLSSGSRWRVDDIADAYSKKLVSDYENSKIGFLSKDVYTEYDVEIERSFVTSYVSNQGTPVFVNELELRSESGVGTPKGSETGQTPSVALSYSDDGGHTFASVGSRDLGRDGVYNIRQIWRRLGRVPYQRAFKFSISDPVKVSFLQLTADIEGGY